ncbi:MAG: hypothetical protein JXR96_19640 [Deltaproteobacteria bacterium]|nr:hypothetical protein [Deltaproteobacteria bacterium]
MGRTGTFIVFSIVLCLGFSALADETDAVRKGLRILPAKSLGCGKKGGKLASRAEQRLRSRLERSRAFRVLGARGTKTSADLMLEAKLSCAGQMTLNLSLLDVQTAEVLWARARVLEGPDELDDALDDGARLLAEFARSGKQPRQVDGRDSRVGGLSLVLSAVLDPEAKLEPRDRQRLARKLRRALAYQGYCDAMPTSTLETARSRDSFLKRAENEGADRAVLVELGVDAGSCVLELSLFDVSSGKVERKASARAACRIQALEAEVEELVRRLVSKVE